jgi:RNA polymerase sigma factor (sigma-70 family)
MLDVNTKQHTQEKPECEQCGRSHRRFNRLYAELAPRVLGYLLRRMPSRADAEDVLQETFLAAYAGRQQYRGSAQPLAWLLGIARRRCADRLRQPENLELVERDERDSHDLAQAVVNALTLEEAVQALPSTLQEALELIVLQQLTYKEAAALLGTPQGTLKWRVHEATRLLRLRLSPSENLK